jgi:predicted aldo/keto reductase-like oxidoreductase
LEYASYGKTGRSVSRLGFGGTIAGLANYLGAFDPNERENAEQIIEAIHTALELGVTYFDTAWSYGNGTSERIFGEALEKADASKIFLATKALASDAKTARASLERSLKNLRRDSIDLIQIHGSFYSDEMCDMLLKKGGMAEELEKAKREGLASFIGFTIECQNTSVYRLIRSGIFDVMQIQYNLIFQHPYDPSWKCGSIYEAEENGLGIACMRSMTSGIFQKWIQIANPENTFDYTPSLLQFALSNPLVDVVLAGMRSAEEVKENVKTVEDLSGRIDLDGLHTRYV